LTNRRKDNALCSVTIIHDDILSKVRKEMTEDSRLVQMAELFKALDDPTRLKIINALLLAEMCVCDISALLNMTQPAISHHLKVLRQTQLIKYRREGKIVYYSLDDDHVELLFRQGRDIRLIMAGQGPSEQEIRALSAALGLEDAVVHAGHITDVRLLDGLYTRADLFVFPSLYDNAPMVVREAAAVGTPSLLTRGSSAAEVVRDGENGLLADDTTADMAACIAWALDNPVRLREIGMAAWATIPKPWEEVITEVLARYEDLIRTMQPTITALKNHIP